MNGLLDKTQPFLGQENNHGKEKCLYGLSYEIVKALKSMGFNYPTLIQAKAIPIILSGKDVIIRAKTGTGKTIAYLAPMIHSLHCISGGVSSVGLVFLPSNDLALQVEAILKNLAKHTNLACIHLRSNEQGKTLCNIVIPTIILATPSKFLSIVSSLQEAAVTIKALTKFVVVDEADLVCDFGHSSDVSKIITQYLPQSCQRIMISATLLDITAGTKSSLSFLKSVMLVNPVRITLTEEKTNAPASDITNVTQHYVLVKDEAEKDRLVYALLYLKLISGKVLFFVNTCNDSYKYQLLLESFGKKGVIVLNKLLTEEARKTKIQLFNKSLNDVIIAVDGEPTADNKNYNISRGIDLEGVRFVVNIGCPRNIEQYIHRIGRTARRGMSGTSLLILTEKEDEQIKLLNEIIELMPPKKFQGKNIPQPSLLELDKKDLLPFKYRVNDARNRITKTAINFRKVKDLKVSILQSKRFSELSKEIPGNLTFLQSKASNLSKVRLRSLTLQGQMPRSGKNRAKRRKKI